MSAIYAIVVDPDVTGRHDRSVARILGTVSLLQAALDLSSSFLTETRGVTRSSQKSVPHQST
jgi:hypothetical protein